MTRADRNNNPMAFTTAVASLALTKGVDYEIGDSFTVNNVSYYTAKILGDPIDVTIKLIDRIGFMTRGARPVPRWVYADGPIMVPFALWHSLSKKQKMLVIAYSYQREGGTEMEGLFSPNAQH